MTIWITLYLKGTLTNYYLTLVNAVMSIMCSFSIGVRVRVRDRGLGSSFCIVVQFLFLTLVAMEIKLQFSVTLFNNV